MLTTISASDLRQRLDRNPDLAVINVLEEPDFEARHIPGSLNAPHAEPGFIDRVESIVGDHDAEVVVYCASAECNASEQAARKLRDAGFRNVVDFEAGTEGWADAGYELQGTDAR